MVCLSHRACHEKAQVNNAGMGQMAEEFTPEGVGIQAQINYLGPYHLTRLLEGLLASTAAETGHARIVNVSSVTHRYAYIQRRVSCATHRCAYNRRCVMASCLLHSPKTGTRSNVQCG